MIITMLKGKGIKRILFALYRPLQRLLNRYKKPKHILYMAEEIKKYLVVGGMVTSKTDGDRHFISARRLVDLYRVKLEDCILIRDVSSHELEQFRGNKNLIWLRPDFTGNYIVPKKLPIKCDMKDRLIKMGYRNEEWD